VLALQKQKAFVFLSEVKNKNMINALLKFAFSVAVVLGCTYLFWFVETTDVRSAILFVAVIGLLNIFVKPLLTILTIPITIFTLGFFLLIINTIIVRIADYFIDGFSIDTFWHTFLFSLVYSLSNALFDSLFTQKKK
jgi:putative membrane protein